MYNIFIDHLFESTTLGTILNICLLILCLYPITGSFLWFFGAILTVSSKQIRKTIPGQLFLLINNQ